jgi:hypothetical protein
MQHYVIRLSVASDRSAVFSGQQYSWNIGESGVKLHNIEIVITITFLRSLFIACHLTLTTTTVTRKEPLVLPTSRRQLHSLLSFWRVHVVQFPLLHVIIWLLDKKVEFAGCILPSSCKVRICCFSAKHATLKRKSKDWLVRNQDNVSECGDASIHELLFYWASTLKIQLSMLV